MTAHTEVKILSKIVNNPAALELVWDLGLRPDAFEEPVYRSAYQLSVDYWRRSQMQSAPTVAVLRREFPDLPLLAADEVDETLYWLVDDLQRRYATNMGQQLVRSTLSMLDTNPKEALATLAADAYRAAQVTVPRYERADMSSNVESRRERYSRGLEQGTNGMTLGLPELDTHTGGVLPGEIALLAGFAKTGKSFWLPHCAVRARRLGFTPLLVTLEQPISEMQDRVDALASGVSYNRLSKRTLQMAETNQLRRAQDEMAELGPIYVERLPRGERTVVDIVNRARHIGADYLIIDQLTFMEPTGNPRSEKEKFANIIFALKDEVGVEASGKMPVLIAHQLNRKSLENNRDSGGGARGAMHNLAGAAEIEQTCDILLGLWRTPEMRNNLSMGLDIMGARRSDTGSWLLAWELVERTHMSVRQAL